MITPTHLHSAVQNIGSASLAIFALGAILFAPVAHAQTQPPSMSPAPQSGAGGNAPAVPTGGGPSGKSPAPQPPSEQNVILPSASGHINSAAPTMDRSCETASPDRAGTGVTDGKSDPCLKDASEADKLRAPIPSR